MVPLLEFSILVLSIPFRSLHGSDRILIFLHDADLVLIVYRLQEHCCTGFARGGGAGAGGDGADVGCGCAALGLGHVVSQMTILPAVMAAHSSQLLRAVAISIPIAVSMFLSISLCVGLEGYALGRCRTCEWYWL